MGDIGKTIIFIGLALVIIGLLIMLLGKFTPVGRLPGDLFFKKDNFSFYFPITTCILLSLIISLIMYFISRK